MDNIVRSICHNLADSDQALRNKALRNVKELFKKNPDLDYLNLQKICKGLYYCLWMADDYIQVHKLSIQIVQLYKHIKPKGASQTTGNKETVDMDLVDLRMVYLRCLLETICREWPLLDKNRVDKMMLFTRIYVSEILYYMDELAWDPLVLNKLSEMYLNPSLFNANCLGLQLHLIQIYINEFVLNYEDLRKPKESESKANKREKSKKKLNGNAVQNNSESSGHVNKIDAVKLVYLLKPFILMFVRTKDKLILTNINVYIFKNLEKLEKIAKISIVLHVLKSLLEGSSRSGEKGHGVTGMNKKIIEGTLAEYEDRVGDELTDDEKFHADQVLYSVFPPTESKDGLENNIENEQVVANGAAAQEEEDEEPFSGTLKTLYQRRAAEILNGEQTLLSGNFISLSNVVTRRMTRRRLQNLCILNTTKNYLKLVKVDDENSKKFLDKLKDPRVENQLFYYSLTRLRRLKLQFRFKNYELNKIYNFNKDFKSNFKVNLKQALDNIKNIKPTKSSLMNHDSVEKARPKRKKRVVFNLKKNQVTNIPSRKKKTRQPCIILPDKYIFVNQ